MFLSIRKRNSSHNNNNDEKFKYKCPYKLNIFRKQKSSLIYIHINYTKSVINDKMFGFRPNNTVIIVILLLDNNINIQT